LLHRYFPWVVVAGVIASWLGNWRLGGDRWQVSRAGGPTRPTLDPSFSGDAAEETPLANKILAASNVK